MDENITARKPVLYPTTPDTTIAVGDLVRSFDFPGDASCYFVGTVSKVLEPLKQYIIDVEYQVWGGKRAETNYCAQVMPPMNGTTGWCGKFCGVQRVQRGEEE